MTQRHGTQNAAPRRQDGAALAGLAGILLEAARGHGLVQDLLEAFGGDDARAGEILALAFFACTEKDGFERLPAWRSGPHAPRIADLAPAQAASVLAGIPPEAAADFLALRRARHAGGPFLAGLSLPALHEGQDGRDSGQNGGRLGIVYAMPSMEPVHCMALPAGSDCLADAAALSLEAEALGMPLASTAFGKEPGRTDLYRDLLEAGRPFLAPANPAEYPAYWRIRDNVEFDRHGLPANMDLDLETKRYTAQFGILDTDYRTPGGEWKIAGDYACSLSLSLPERTRVLVDLDSEARLAERFAKDRSAARTQADLDAMNRRLRYHVLQFGHPPFGKPGEVFALCRADELRHARAAAGFTAAVAWKTPASPGEILRAAAVRDGQELFFQRLQERAAGLASGLAGAQAQARFTEGLRFAGFVGFILHAFARRLWEESADLREAFASPDEALQALCSKSPERGAAPSPLEREGLLPVGTVPPSGGDAGGEEAE